ncbi:hypothetical protein HCN44_007578 [Aphidius gifuensis]|uniref:BTB domain-containing protein n=2 Tax=Aphidius gifuensis TaxID=684658 RepID=A0A835CM73_APHGI|nr:protein tramtrack, alpha isoform-like isoform X3 [Aphidius gifuensis]KAF7988084.1 hypothetical protein HCN44_007578 [Aphidius gifuensis]
MSMQQYCLRWNNHQPNFISVFSSLLSNETLVDVTLAAEGRHLQAHKVVLSACSTYFQSLFTVNPCQHPIVILKDVKYTDLKIMVDFMYYGEVNVSQDQLPSIIKTAESLKIKGLADMHTAQLTKWPSGSSEPSEVNCGESCSPSPSPISPSFRRKRLRKTSTGSTSGSGEKPEDCNEITLVAMNVVKPEPAIVNQEVIDNRRPINVSNESQGSIEEDQISIMSNMESNSAVTPAQNDNSMQNVNQQPTTNVAQTPGPTGHTPAHQGFQGRHVGTKKSRLMLVRQPRVKKDAEPDHRSPEIEPNPSRIVSPGCSVTPTLSIPSTSQEWHNNEPSTPSAQNLLTLTSTTNLLAVPQSQYLVKQHSHPLLPSQQQSGSVQHWIPRQHSNPEYPRVTRTMSTTSTTTTTDTIPLIKIEEGQNDDKLTKDCGNTSSTGLRIVPPEFLRSSSTPQISTTSSSLEPRSSDQRQGHCPVQRPGPALGCNHCWNTVDTHGRTLRRKTKYHCPECQINLCIVPCFQEFHERSREPTTTMLKTLPKTSSI